MQDPSPPHGNLLFYARLCCAKQGGKGEGGCKNAISEPTLNTSAWENSDCSCASHGHPGRAQENAKLGHKSSTRGEKAMENDDTKAVDQGSPCRVAHFPNRAAAAGLVTVLGALPIGHVHMLWIVFRGKDGMLRQQGGGGNKRMGAVVQ